MAYCAPLNILLPIVTMSALIMHLAPAIHQTGTTLQIFGKGEMELILKLLIFGLGIISCRFHCKIQREEHSRFRRLHHTLPLQRSLREKIRKGKIKTKTYNGRLE